VSPFLRYTLLRLALLVGAGGVLWLVGLRGLPWAVVTVAVAAVAAYLLLTGPREAVLQQWSERGAGTQRRRLTDEEAEDGSYGDGAPDGRDEGRGRG